MLAERFDGVAFVFVLRLGFGFAHRRLIQILAVHVVHHLGRAVRGFVFHARLLFARIARSHRAVESAFFAFGRLAGAATGMGVDLFLGRIAEVVKRTQIRRLFRGFHVGFERVLDVFRRRRRNFLVVGSGSGGSLGAAGCVHCLGHIGKASWFWIRVLVFIHFSGAFAL